tara:strand:- start:16093 stop:16302 length:210 start_codon:yes stop_codon:yes gene_type:complete
MVKDNNNTRSRRSRRWNGCGILKLFVGVILGIICLPFICFIVKNEKDLGKDPSHRKERMERRHSGIQEN